MQKTNDYYLFYTRLSLEKNAFVISTLECNNITRKNYLSNGIISKWKEIGPVKIS